MIFKSVMATVLGGMALATVAAGPAMAQDDDGTGLDPSLPIPTLKYDRPPPNFSWDVALQGSYGQITRWQDEVIPGWIGFGIRGAWGKNLTPTGAHRVGLHILLFLEGPAPVHMTTGLEPMFGWDYVASSGFWVGAGAGVGALYHVKASARSTGASVSEPGFGLAAAGRIGWSQTYTRVGRRLFIGVEPKVRWMSGRSGVTAALIVGSGQGY